MKENICKYSNIKKIYSDKYEDRTKKTINEFIHMFGIKRLDIGVATFNRLTYLRRCIWSIIASTSINNHIFVVNDMSNDGSAKFLEQMEADGYLTHIKPNKKLGAGATHNLAIESAESNWIAYFNDDMWVHRGWDLACMRIVMQKDDCGIVNLNNYHQTPDFTVEDYGDHRLLNKTACGAMFINKELFNKAEGFKPKGMMGYFATPFIRRTRNVNLKRKKIYTPSPYFVEHMDRPTNRMCSQHHLKEYGEYRKKHKKGWGG